MTIFVTPNMENGITSLRFFAGLTTNLGSSVAPVCVTLACREDFPDPDSASVPPWLERAPTQSSLRRSVLRLEKLTALFVQFPTLCRFALIGAFGSHLLRDTRFLPGAGNHKHSNTL